MKSPTTTLVVSVERGHTRLQHSSGTEEALPLKTEEAATLPPYETAKGLVSLGTPNKTLVVSVERGHTNCRECPFCEPSGVVEVFGGPRRSRCRQIMSPYFFDCHEFDVRTIRILPSAPGERARKPRKPYRKDHKEIHPIGWHRPSSKRASRDERLNAQQ